MNSTKSKRTLLSAILAIAFVLCAAPGIYFLMPKTQSASAENAHDTTHSGWSELTADTATLTGGNNYYLSSNVDLTTDLTVSGTVTLCLNGYMLTGTGSSSVITVESGATLTLCDCDTMTSHNYYVDSNGKYVFVKDTSDSNYNAAQEKGTIQGGVITGGNASFGGSVNAFGTFNMSGGTIAGNTANFEGGGVRVSGTFNMSGGTISGNRAYNYGGGVYAHGVGFTVKGGEITGNTAESYGSGVANYGPFTIESGYFGENYIYTVYSSIVTITGGYFASADISANTAAGIAVESGYTVVDISQDEKNYGDTGYNDDYPYAVYATRTPPEYSVTAENITYGETLAPVVENNTYNVEVTYSYTGTDGQPIEGLPTAAGTHTVTATFAKYVDGANKLYYPSTSVEFTVEIAHRQLTIDSVEVTVSTDDSGTPTATVTYLSISGMEEGDDVTVTATVTEVTGSAESGWKVQVTYSLSGEDAGNYIAPEASYINVTNDLGSAVSALEAAIEELKEDIGTVDGTDLQTQITNINGLITAAVDSFDGLTDTTADISDLAGGLAQLISQLETLKDTVATINSDYITGTGLETALGTLQNNIETAFEEADGKLQTAIDSINTALTEAIDKVDELLSADGTTVDSATLAEALANLIDAYKAADDALATDISGDMTELENTLIEADKALDIAIKGVQENLDKAVKDLEEAIAAKADSAALTQAINGLTTAYKAADELINADIDGIESDISGLESKLDEAQTTLQESINTVQNNLDKAVEELKAAIDKASGGNIAALEQAIEELEAAYATADGLLAADVEALESADGELTADIEALDAAYKAADTALWEAIEALQAAVDGNSSDIDGLTTALWIIGAVAVIALAGAAAGIVLALRKKNK